MKNRNYYIINALTWYRLLAAPVLLVLIFTGQYHIFKWLLPVSFFTDLIDGTLARKFKVTSVFGSQLDSIGDDLTMLCGIIAAFVFKFQFISEQKIIAGILIILLLTQNILALIRYRKLSSFHTYLAKIAAILQGTFLILLFLLPQPVYPLFYAAAIVSILDLIEETIMVLMLKEWKADVKGIYWALKIRRRKETSTR